MTEFITRFAPSPTGLLHLGHVASAFHVWKAAERAGGKVLLRIEDIDPGRCKPEYTDAIFEDLAWLGLEWSGDVRVQSDHVTDYLKVVERLTGLGLTYRCFRTRREIAEEQAASRLPPDAPFIGQPLDPASEAMRLSERVPFVWRLCLDRCRSYLGPGYDQLSFDVVSTEGNRDVVKARPDLHGDINLTRKDAPIAYHVAATHDDALQGVTHVIRGEDLADAAHIHVLIQALMGWPQPVYTHHKLVMGPDGKRLAKRFKSKSLASLRSEGLSPDQIRAMAGV